MTDKNQALLSIEKLQTALQDFVDVYNVLSADTLESGKFLRQDSSNFWLRTHIRTFFALVEGTTFGLKQVALMAHEYRPCFTEAEISLLKEVSYELRDGGKAIERTKHLETLSNIKFTFKSVSKAFALGIEIPFDTYGWRCFQESLEIRHHITHPKNVANLMISELDNGQGEKVDLVMEALSWYLEQLNLLAAKILAALYAESERIFRTNDIGVEQRFLF